MFYCFIYIQNKWIFLKKAVHAYKLSLYAYNQILGLLYSILFSCSDSVGYGNSLSNLITKSVINFFFFTLN